MVKPDASKKPPFTQVILAVVSLLVLVITTFNGEIKSYFAHRMGSETQEESSFHKIEQRVDRNADNRRSEQRIMSRRILFQLKAHFNEDPEFAAAYGRSILAQIANDQDSSERVMDQTLYKEFLEWAGAAAIKPHRRGGHG